MGIRTESWSLGEDTGFLVLLCHARMACCFTARKKWFIAAVFSPQYSRITNSYEDWLFDPVPKTPTLLHAQEKDKSFTSTPSPRQPVSRRTRRPRSRRTTPRPRADPAAPSPAAPFPGPLAHQVAQAEVLPRGALRALRGALDAEGGVLVGDDVVLVLRVDGLVLGRDVDVVVREAVAAEVLEEVGVALVAEVDEGDR